MQVKGTFWTHDSGLHISRDDGTDDARSMLVMKSLLGVLVRHGWKIGRDPRIEKDFACLGPMHRRGRRGDLEVKAECGGCMIHVEFFQNVANVENRNGGEYDFSKLSKMPYLLRLRAQLEMRSLCEKAGAIGLHDNRSPIPADAFDAVRLKILKTAEWHPDVVDGPRQDCNGKDADGRQIANGDFRCFYHYTGTLMRGQCFYNLNNMWWVVVNRDYFSNVAAFELFTFDPLKHGPRRKRHPEKAIARRLADAIIARDFRRAERIQNAIDREGIPVRLQPVFSNE